MSREMKDSGVEWIGEIPEDWDVKRIKHAVVQMGSGTTPNSDNSNFYDGNIAWIQSGDLYNTPIITKTSKTVTEQAIQRCSALKIYHKPYIVIAMYGASVGNVSIASIDACTNQACCIIKPNDNNNIDYLKYWLEVCKTDFIRKSVGGGQPNISQDKVREQTYLCPSPTEQQQIVHFLDRKCTAIDTAIEKTKKSIEKLEEYKKAVITKAVTKGIDPNAKMKDSGVEWCPQIPEHWSVVNPKALFSQRTERILPGDKQLTASQEHGIIYQDEYTKATGSRVVAVIRDFSILKHVEPNDFVISMRSFQGGLEYSEKRGCISSAYVMLIPNTKYVYPPFYRWFFKSSKYINALQSTSNFVRDGQAMRYSHFIQIPLFVIPLTEQKQIANYLESKVNAIMVLIQKKQMAIAKWEEYKKSLIYYAVTGKIDCRNEVI
ncbi:restriction endonuclease subunit S [Clostridium sp. OF03-18AA]|nr:restriction endonuclease subunit S [Clostridium sp. OF03-18AA]RHP71032.1 restriction endonuclease subunit S [Clostridium sp. OF03-18AA]